MDMWGAYFDHALVFFNLLILSYFVLGNGVYTALMVISVRAIWFHLIVIHSVMKFIANLM